VNGHCVLRAVKDSNLTMVRRCLERGANLEVVDGSGLSALHWAVLGDHVQITSVLLNHSADPNMRTSLQNTPLHRAARVGNFPACRYNMSYTKLTLGKIYIIHTYVYYIHK
jgi:FOG: Ankyrin repeat